MLVKNNKETTMKFKSVAAATLAVATLDNARDFAHFGLGLR